MIRMAPQKSQSSVSCPMYSVRCCRISSSSIIVYSIVFQADSFCSQRPEVHIAELIPDEPFLLRHTSSLKSAFSRDRICSSIPISWNSLKQSVNDILSSDFISADQSCRMEYFLLPDSMPHTIPEFETQRQLGDLKGINHSQLGCDACGWGSDLNQICGATHGSSAP